MITQSVGIRSLAVSFPQTIRSNTYWLNKFPDKFSDKAASPRSIRPLQPISIPTNPTGLDIWLQEVTPYLSDPFRGTVERRVLAPNESSRELECQAAERALQAANLSPNQINLAIVASLFPDAVGPGLAAHLAQDLGLSCPAWTLESTCASALIALQTAQALVQAGLYQTILIVVSHIGSRSVNETDTLSWSMGDGAGAWVVGEVAPNQGILTTQVTSTTTTVGAYVHELVIDDHGNAKIQTRTGDMVSRLAETAADTVRHCSQAAVNVAGINLRDIKVFALNTPTAWYANVCARALEVAPDLILNLYPLYANIGPVFPIANLYYAASSGKIRENDLVLVYANGAGTTAAATVMRWGAVALGSAPGESFPQSTPLVSTVTLPTISAGIDTTSGTDFALEDRRTQILTLGAGERQREITTYLIEWLAQAKQLTPTQLHAEVLLSTLLDSLMAIVFRNQLETEFQIRVPIENFFGDHTISHLSDYLLKQLAIAELMASHETWKSEIAMGDREMISL
jgi:3-oxoacyl-[acyl-carrier-protein] synthase III/acyl carrier protein